MVLSSKRSQPLSDLKYIFSVPNNEKQETTTNVGELVANVTENVYQLYDAKDSYGWEDKTTKKENMASIIYVIFFKLIFRNITFSPRELWWYCQR